MHNSSDRQGKTDRESEYMRSGKGRKDEVGGSGIYPASVPNAPADAELRTEGDLVNYSGPHRSSTKKENENTEKADRGAGERTDESAGSE